MNRYVLMSATKSGFYSVIDREDYRLHSASNPWIIEKMSSDEHIDGVSLDSNGDVVVDEKHLDKLNISCLKYRMLTGLNVVIVDDVLMHLTNPDRLPNIRFTVSKYCRFAAESAFNGCVGVTVVLDDKLDHFVERCFKYVTSFFVKFDITQMKREDLLDSFYLGISDSIAKNKIQSMKSIVLDDYSVSAKYIPAVDMWSGKYSPKLDNECLKVMERLYGDSIRETLNFHSTLEHRYSGSFNKDVRYVLDQLRKGYRYVNKDLIISVTSLHKFLSWALDNETLGARLAAYIKSEAGYDLKLDDVLAAYFDHVVNELRQRDSF